MSERFVNVDRGQGRVSLCTRAWLTAGQPGRQVDEIRYDDDGRIVEVKATIQGAAIEHHRTHATALLGPERRRQVSLPLPSGWEHEK